jgi:hypothetical protein
MATVSSPDRDALLASFDGEQATSRVKPRSQQINWSDGPRMTRLRFFPVTAAMA